MNLMTFLNERLEHLKALKADQNNNLVNMVKGNLTVDFRIPGKKERSEARERGYGPV